MISTHNSAANRSRIGQERSISPGRRTAVSVGSAMVMECTALCFSSWLALTLQTQSTPLAHAAPSPRWGEGGGEGLGLSRDRNPSPQPSPYGRGSPHEQAARQQKFLEFRITPRNTSHSAP